MERKFLDCALQDITMQNSDDGSAGELQPTSGCVGCISVPTQADGPSSRDGRKYTLLSAFVSGVVFTSARQNQADVSEQFGYFFALVLDKQANGVTIASEDVYINPGSNTAILPSPLRNLQNSARFSVLDSVYVLPGGMYAGTDGTNTNSVINQVAPVVKLNWSGSIECIASGTAADVANASDNALHVICFAGATNLTPVFNGKSRVRFIG